jgi:hypothetical protein
VIALRVQVDIWYRFRSRRLREGEAPDARLPIATQRVSGL